jgi:hypothetical protein
MQSPVAWCEVEWMVWGLRRREIASASLSFKKQGCRVWVRFKEGLAGFSCTSTKHAGRGAPIPPPPRRPLPAWTARADLFLKQTDWLPFYSHFEGAFKKCFPSRPQWQRQRRNRMKLWNEAEQEDVVGSISGSGRLFSSRSPMGAKERWQLWISFDWRWRKC